MGCNAQAEEEGLLTARGEPETALLTARPLASRSGTPYSPPRTNGEASVAGQSG